MNALAADGAALLGGDVRDWCVLHGGDLSEIVRITLTDGRSAVVKSTPAARAEAEMLRAIAATGAPAPAILAVSGTRLVMAEVRSDGSIGGGPDEVWGSLGRAVAQLHAATGPFYGWHCDYAFGAVTIGNTPTQDWPGFWARHRLLTHVAHVPPDIGCRIEKLAAGLVDRLPAQPVAALLHGDLWGGNVLAADGQVTGLIDPSCYYGHAEADLAMLTLFDRPAASFAEAYGWREPGVQARLPIYQLWPALVHLRLFGQGYRPMVERFLGEAGV